MIKTIQYHLAPTPEQQTQLEEDHAVAIRSQWQTNRAVFAAMMPNLLPFFDDESVDEYGLFCNKNGQLNLAGKTNGQVIYGLEPKAECAADIAHFQKAAPVFSLSGQKIKYTPLLRAYQMPESQGYVPALPLQPLPEHPDTIILLGLGLGHVLEELLKVCTPKNIVVYEPTLDFFRGSLQAANWQAILMGAQERGVRLFLQIGQDASGISSDLTELRQAFQVDQVFALRHYHHPLMDAIFDYLVSPDFSLDQLVNGNVEVQPTFRLTQYLPPRAGRIESHLEREEAAEKVTAARALKLKNLAAFAEQFPDIYEQFAEYQPQQWQAFIGDDGELNVYHETRLGALYHARPSELAAQTQQLFSEEPNRNDMFAGYTGGKLRRYVHFRHARKFGKLFDELEDDGQFVPDVLSSLIWFGLGLGYQLESFVQSYDIKSMYIYEPNPDFFYWSLFTVPWHEILPRQREAGMHWYLNIGDDGTYLAEDMFEQFHSDGGYLTASAFFYVPMHYPGMQANIQQLRRDFKSYLMLCEYYDHVRYFLRHSETNLERGAMVLRNNPSLPPEMADRPVMLVGNGPSLDDTIAQLQARRDEFVVVSCGTALKPLYEAGITPDFHTDVEQNRVTYQWVTQVPDRDWLKQITALTLTSYHPDTVALFKDHWVVFKYGEAGTAAFLRPEKYNNAFFKLDYCYPTVTNMAIALVVSLGFKNIYLTGVDLGFKSHDHHHSKNSAYYQSKDSKSWHDYKKVAGEGIPVRGNFDPMVFTKYEFQLSSRIMSQLLRLHPDVRVVNTSDGAYIEGTQSCRFAELPEFSAQNRSEVLGYLQEHLFTREGVDAMLQRVQSRNQREHVSAEVDAMLAILDEPVTTRQEAMDRLGREKEFLLDMYRQEQSLWFYLIFSSAHFVSAALVRLLYLSNDEAQSLENFQRGTEIWREYLAVARDEWLDNGDALDQTVIKSLLPPDPAAEETPVKPT
ncbi:MAG: motility associated factor glycosyltransferase family protein [Idiomarina sp.]|nr:motility associated factor glycosyltransferase family protein [Idiomarina sp.]